MSLFDEQTKLTHLESLFLPTYCLHIAMPRLPTTAALAKSFLVFIGFAFRNHVLVHSFHRYKGESSLYVPPRRGLKHFLKPSTSQSHRRNNLEGPNSVSRYVSVLPLAIRKSWLTHSVVFHWDLFKLSVAYSQDSASHLSSKAIESYGNSSAGLDTVGISPVLSALTSIRWAKSDSFCSIQLTISFSNRGYCFSLAARWCPGRNQ